MGRENEGAEVDAGFGSGSRGRNTAEGIGNDVFFAGFVLEGSTKLINEDTPTKDSLSVEFGKVVSEVLVVTVNDNFITE